jgi:hypothetical protein
MGDSGDGGATWRFSPTGDTDGATLSGVVLTSSVTPQVYSRTNPTAFNPNAVTAGSYMEYDFHLQHNAALGAQQYSFRLVEATGTLLSEYPSCPTLVTKPQTTNQMRHGNFFEARSRRSTDPVSPTEYEGKEAGFSWAD